MNKIMFPFLAVLGLLFIAPSPNQAQFYEDSSLWPPRVVLTEPLEIDGQDTIPEGRRGILIRIEKQPLGSERLLLDFGSLGVHRVAPDQTDIARQVTDFQNGEAKKSIPNWTMMIGRGFVEVDDGKISQVSLDSLKAFELMLIVYLDPLIAGDMAHIAKGLKDVSPLLEDSATLVLLFPLNQSIKWDHHEILKLSGEHELKFFYLYPYLANAFLKSLAHVDEATRLPLVVLVDAEGKTLGSGGGDDALDLKKTFESISAIREP